jgi:hypothetical protein
MKLFVLSLALAAAVIASDVSPINDDDKCCSSCTGTQEKYYSIDKIHNMCGECCMEPKDYWKVCFFTP